jgi:hypothetical protein
MQVGGNTPASLAPEVRATVDLLTFYGTQLRRQALSGNMGNFAAVGTIFGGGAPVTCQPGEMWLVDGVTAQCTGVTPALTDAKIILGLQRTNGPAIFEFWAETLVTVGAGEWIFTGKHFDSPLLMLPGDVLGIGCTRLAAGGPIGPFFMNLTYTRVPI